MLKIAVSAQNEGSKNSFYDHQIIKLDHYMHQKIISVLAEDNFSEVKKAT
jgi:hypothetical protein